MSLNAAVVLSRTANVGIQASWSGSTDGRQVDAACEYSVKVGGVPLHGAVPMAEHGFSSSDWPEAQILLGSVPTK